MAALRFLALLPAALHLLLLCRLGCWASSDHVLLEEGYTVTTVMEGHKLRINPRSVQPVYGSSSLIVLDSAASAFYSLSLPVSDDVKIERWSGNGVGYSDGEMASAKFNQPRSFASDFKGNVYVADQRNHAIRKITNSGVTTIAGGSEGRADGPGQNATFSIDFELSFVPQSCSLLVSDHGNQLIRQILLKEEDCRTNKDSPSAMSAVSIWALGLCLSGFLGLAIGIAIRPYIFHHEETNSGNFNATWRHCLINLGKQARRHYSGIRNGVAKSITFQLLRRVIMLSISQLSLMIYNLHNPNRRPKEHVSLLDSDTISSDEVACSQSSWIYDHQLNGLKTFEGFSSSEATDENQEIISSDSDSKVDYMIRANIMAFEGMKGPSIQVNDSSSSGSFSGLVKRR